MVKLKPKKEQDRETPGVNYRRFRFKHLLLFILGSAIAHGLIFLLLAYYKPVRIAEEKAENKPIDFVVIPPEEPTPAPEPAPEPEPEPEPAPAPAPAPASEPAPAPEPTPEPEPKEPSAEDLLSGSDTPVAAPKPQEEESVATRLPPETEPVPKPATPENGSAADLLGGDYKKTLANSGDAFFSPEALTHRTVLDPSQVDALKDLDLSAYFAKVQQHIDKHERLVLEQEYTAVLIVDIQKSGQITGLKIQNRLGPEEYDRRFLARFQEIAPFPPLPPEFPLESLQDVPIDIYTE